MLRIYGMKTWRIVSMRSEGKGNSRSGRRRAYLLVPYLLRLLAAQAEGLAVTGRGSSSLRRPLKATHSLLDVVELHKKSEAVH